MINNTTYNISRQVHYLFANMKKYFIYGDTLFYFIIICNCNEQCGGKTICQVDALILLTKIAFGGLS